MIKHIVMFKLQDFAEDAPKSENALKVIDILNQLPAKIDLIKYYELRLNEKEAPPRSADIVLISGFNTWQDLDEYMTHPEHLKCVDFILKVRQESWMVDYEE